MRANQSSGPHGGPEALALHRPLEATAGGSCEGREESILRATVSAAVAGDGICYMLLQLLRQHMALW
jgi:hypothetical protein